MEANEEAFNSAIEKSREKKQLLGQVLDVGNLDDLDDEIGTELGNGDVVESRRATHHQLITERRRLNGVSELHTGAPSPSRMFDPSRHSLLMPGHRQDLSTSG